MARATSITAMLAILAGSALTAAAQVASGGGAGGGAVTPPEYVIGPGDVLSIRFWRQPGDVSSDVVVRPDGKISLLLLDDITAAGLTPEELRDRIREASERLFEDPQVTVIVKEIHSRIVFITGLVARPGQYPLNGELRVIQLIAMAGGLLEFADGKRIVIMRNEGGRQTGYRFNYESIRQLRPGEFDQNIQLKPGDTVIVP